MVKKLLSVRVFDSNQHALRSPGTTMIRPPREQRERTQADGEDEVEEPAKMWAKSVVDIEGEILCVSQFTLYGSVIKGSKPDFHLSMKSETSKQMYLEFLDRLKKAYQPDRIKDGEFGAMMLVNIANDGPVTLELDSRKFEYSPITHQSNPAVFKALKAANPNPKVRDTVKNGKPEKQGKPGKQGSNETQDQEKQDQDQEKKETKTTLEEKGDDVNTVAGKLAESLAFDKEPTP